MFDQAWIDYLNEQQGLAPLQPMAPPGSSYIPAPPDVQPWTGGNSVLPPHLMPPPPPPVDITDPSKPAYEASMGGGLLDSQAMGLGGGSQGQGGGFLSGLFGGGGPEGMSGGKDWGSMLMALGGGIAGNATQGWGAGIGAGFQGAALANMRSKENAQQEAYRQQVLKMRQAEMNQGPAPLASEREFERANKDPAYAKFLMQRDQAQGTRIVNNMGSNESEFGKEASKNFGAIYTDMNKGAVAAQSQISSLNALEQNLGKAGFTGLGGENLLKAKKAALAIGIDVGDVSGEEAALAIQNKIALELRSTAEGGGMPGAMSDADREFLLSATPGLTKTPEGNKKLIDYMKRTEKRKIEVAEFANKYVVENGKLDAGFYQALRNWSEANPMFTKEEQQQQLGGGNIPAPPPGFVVQ
jgi:hypothetical protein